jgi:hypothetical protein
MGRPARPSSGGSASWPSGIRYDPKYGGPEDFVLVAVFLENWRSAQPGVAMGISVQTDMARRPHRFGSED